MILKFNNKPYTIIKKLDHLGPEPHYECKHDNEIIVLAIQKSGIICQRSSELDDTLICYESEDCKFHRENGPAFDHKENHITYFIKGKEHRLDGPAREWHDGTVEFWVNGKNLWKEQFDKKYGKKK